MLLKFTHFNVTGTITQRTINYIFSNSCQHFLKQFTVFFFRQAFDLLEFDIQELEESLLLMNSEDDSLQLVQRLVIKLLKGCSNTYSKNITTDVSTHALNKRNTL